MLPDDSFFVENELQRRQDNVQKRKDKGASKGKDSKDKDKDKDKDACDDTELDMKDKSKWQALHMSLAESSHLAAVIRE